MLQWKEEYLVGVDLIDEQHMKLIEIANRAYALLKNELITDKYDQTIEIIEELKAYTVYHFNCEEEYMKSIGYKKIFSHSILHREFLDKVSAVNLNEVDDDQNQYLIKIMNFVCDWLVSHIIREDKLITAKLLVTHQILPRPLLLWSFFLLSFNDELRILTNYIFVLNGI